MVEATYNEQMFGNKNYVCMISYPCMLSIRRHLGSGYEASTCMDCACWATVNPLTSLSHWSGFKEKLTFHGIHFFGSSTYTGQVLGILWVQIGLFLIVECIWYNLGHVRISQCMGFN